MTNYVIFRPPLGFNGLYEYKKKKLEQNYIGTIRNIELTKCLGLLKLMFNKL